MAQNTQDEEIFITPQQAGDLAGHLSATYFKDRAVGRKLPLIPSYRFGNRIRFKKSDILAYLNEHIVKPEEKKD
jgi:hypothetical protein